MKKIISVIFLLLALISFKQKKVLAACDSPGCSSYAGHNNCLDEPTGCFPMYEPGGILGGYTQISEADEDDCGESCTGDDRCVYVVNFYTECGGCCGGDGGDEDEGNKFGVFIYSEGDEAQSERFGWQVKNNKECGRRKAHPECSNGPYAGGCGFDEDNCNNPYFVGMGRTGEDTHVSLVRKEYAETYLNCEYYAVWAQAKDGHQIGELVEGESGVGCDAYFKLYGWATKNPIKNIYFKLTGGKFRVNGQVFSRDVGGNKVYWKSFKPGAGAGERLCSETCGSPYNCRFHAPLDVACVPSRQDNRANWKCEEVYGDGINYPYWLYYVNSHQPTTCEVKNLPEVDGVQYYCLNPSDCKVTHPIPAETGIEDWQFEIGPPTCVCPDDWTDAYCDSELGDCGGQNCSWGQMCQTKICTWVGGSQAGQQCDTQYQCQNEDTCLPEGWFQTEDGDVHAGNNINDSIPTTAPEPYCSLKGDGGFPGVISYGGSFPADFDPGGSASEDPFGWLANSAAKNYSYEFFENQVDSPTIIAQDGELSPNEFNALTTGFYLVEKNIVNPDGDLELLSGASQVNVAGEKIVILVPGSLTINQTIDVGKNDNFLGFFVGGDINIDEDIAHQSQTVLEGVYFADGTVNTGVNSGSRNSRLVVEGMFIAGGFSLDRDLQADNNDTPAESFIYRPDLWLSSPQEFWQLKFTWQEVAP